MKQNIYLLGIDMQHDFLTNSNGHKGVLYIPDSEKLIPNFRALLDAAQNASRETPAILTQQWNSLNSDLFSDTPDYQNTFPPFCVMGTPGANVLKELYLRGSKKVEWYKFCCMGCSGVEKNYLLRKNEFDLFQGNRNANFTFSIVDYFDSAIVFGVDAYGAIKSAIQHLSGQKPKIYVVGDAIVANPNNNLDGLLDSYTKSGVELLSTNEATEMIKKNKY